MFAPALNTSTLWVRSTMTPIEPRVLYFRLKQIADSSPLRAAEGITLQEIEQAAGGDSFSAVRIKDGKATEHKVSMALGDPIKEL